MKILGRLETSKNFWFLLFASIFFFILRFPSFFEPYWYGDEGIYQTLGLGINSGRILYRDIFDNKPPLLYILYSIFNSDQFLVRLASAIFGLISVILFFKLCEKILQNKKAVFIATIAYSLLFGLPLIEGNIANAENFMLVFNIAAGILVIKSTEISFSKQSKILFSAGILLGISFLFKIVGFFDFAAFFVFLFIVNFTKTINNENLKNEIKKLFPYILGFFIPILIVGLYFFINGAFSFFIKAAFSNNVGYVGYGNNFIIPQGLLIIKSFFLILAFLFIFMRRKILGNSNIFVYVWILFSLFNAFFSQRPYTHYVLVMLPSLCLLMGFVAIKNRLFKFNSLILTVTIILLVLNFTYFLKTIYYYQNFASFITNQKSINSYQRFFDGNTPNDYELTSFINLKTKPIDNIFIWGNNAQVYKLTNKLPPGRYTVAYHITNYKDGLENTLKGLQKSNPKLIVVMPNTSPYPFSLEKYIQTINIKGINIYERIN